MHLKYMKGSYGEFLSMNCEKKIDKVEYYDEEYNKNFVWSDIGYNGN